MVPVFAVPLAVILHVSSLIKLSRDTPRSVAVAASQLEHQCKKSIGARHAALRFALADVSVIEPLGAP